jgi:L-arabinose transport system substrate-binding protein
MKKKGLAVAMAGVLGCMSLFGATTVMADEEKKEDLKFVYISKQLTHQWFLQEEMGIKKACDELGIEYVGIDSDGNDEKCLADIDNAFSMGADALLMCITNQSMGPNVAKRCAEEGIPLVTIDDNIVDEDGNPVPHVGMPTKEVGELGGEELAKMANERGFFEEGNNVKVLQIDIPTNTVFGPRLEGYKEALMENTPLTEEDFITVEAADPTAAYEGNLTVSSPVILGHPEVTHWIITGANDDCALAPMKILEEQGFEMDNVLACGLGGYEMSLEQFKNGNESYIAIVLQPDVEGYEAVKVAYEYIVNGTEMPENTFISGSIANAENYLEFYPNGKLMTDQ